MIAGKIAGQSLDSIDGLGKLTEKFSVDQVVCQIFEVRIDEIEQILISNSKGVDEETFVICNLGAPSKELYYLNDREQNFYMLGSMGLVSSISLGIAITHPNKQVVCIDGYRRLAKEKESRRSGRAL